MAFWCYILRCADGSLYVGSTWKAVRVRYREHVNGVRAARAIRRYGARKLRIDLAEGRYGLTRESAERIERQHADRLRARGYGVSQG